MNERKSKKKFNNFKKNIKAFMQDEEGYITKKNILKIGLGTISALGIIGSLADAATNHASHNNHSNSTGLIQGPAPAPYHDECYKLKVQHLSHNAHTSHGSY